MVNVKPKGPVPVGALEWRIKEDVPTNLRAVKVASEKLPWECEQDQAALAGRFYPSLPSSFLPGLVHVFRRCTIRPQSLARAGGVRRIRVVARAGRQTLALRYAVRDISGPSNAQLLSSFPSLPPPLQPSQPAAGSCNRA